MQYLIGVVAVVLVGFFLYASLKKKKQDAKGAKHPEDDQSFRTREDLNTYNKPMDDKHSHVDFEDAE